MDSDASDYLKRYSFIYRNRLILPYNKTLIGLSLKQKSTKNQIQFQFSSDPPNPDSWSILPKDLLWSLGASSKGKTTSKI